ncbi:MAG: hypothetical protein QOG26_1054 [Solirubrobacterales bacterium]|nr:hypothetical protein [Solirubrobacterales bacterium]
MDAAPRLRRCRAVRVAPARTWERIGLLALVVALLAGFAIYPSFPTYDSVYSLVWGNEIAHLHAPSFDAYRAPTEHPLGIAVGVLLSPFGDGAGRILEFLILASYAALIAGVYRLGRLAFTPLVGLASALILFSRFDFANLAIRGYIDIPYAAALVWVAALEHVHPRRGAPVWLLLTAAGLLRPEAWGLAILYLIWLAAPAPRQLQARWVLWALAAPAIWLAFDWLATGDPLFSFHATTQTVGELARSRPPAELPGAAYTFLGELIKPPVIAAALAGALLAVWLVPRRAAMPLLILLAGLGTFAVIGAGGLAVIDRYLVLAAVGACLFAGFAVAGFAVLRRGSRIRIVWAAAAALTAAGVLAFTFANTLRFTSFSDELAFRTDSHDSLATVLSSGEVRRRRAAGCGPVSTPTHKLVPDVRLLLDAGEATVVSRNDPAARARASRGLAVYVHGRRAMDLLGFDADTSALTEVPPAGFERLAGGKYFTVFGRC